MKVSAELETFDGDAFAAYGRLCGRALARAHAKSSGYAAQIIPRTLLLQPCPADLYDKYYHL